MKTITTRLPLIVATALFAASGLRMANAQESIMTVDARAPIAATLLSEVRVSASGAVRIASTEALSVTLLPTVHVTARIDGLAMVTLPTVMVHAHAVAPRFDAGDIATLEAAAASPTLKLSPSPRPTAVRALRIEAMPR